MKKEILIIDENTLLQKLWKRKLETKFILYQALNILQAEKLLMEHRDDLSLIAIDHDVPGGSTTGLVQKIVKEGFPRSKLLAISSKDKNNLKLVEVGCGHTSKKECVSERIKEILSL